MSAPTSEPECSCEQCNAHFIRLSNGLTSGFDGLRLGAYRVIVADPAWTFEDQGTRLAPAYEGQQRAAGAHYRVMSLDEIQQLPVSRLAHPHGAWLVLWVPWALLPDGLATMKAWGFDYVTGGPWGKVSAELEGAAELLDAVEDFANARMLEPAKHPRKLSAWTRVLAAVKALRHRIQIGGGHTFRGASEPFLLGRRGKDYPRAQNRSVPNLILAPRGRHSGKPAALLDALEKVFPGPYAELFSRVKREGWDQWGDQL